MADEERRRRRGRRRGGSHPAAGGGQPQAGDGQQPEQSAPGDIDAKETTSDVTAAEAPGDGTGGRRFPFRRGGSSAEQTKKPAAAKPAAGAAAATDVSPMEFWRRGSARSARAAATPQKKLGFWQRITGFHFPAWVPVVGIIVVVFGILGALFWYRDAAGAPRIGSDHWHARYTFTVCGQRQPNAPFWEAGVHTHADGIVHIHPFRQYEEGSGARLVKWFEYGGGELTNDKIRMPGSNDEYETGDTCPDGTEGTLQVFVTPVDTGVEEKLDSVNRYIPQDGDSIRIVFGPVESEPVRAEDRTLIPAEQATRTIEVTVTDDNGDEATTRFEPNRIQVNAEEVVNIVVKNTGVISHGFRVSGVDGEYETSDDFVVTPDGQDPATSSGILQPGTQGTAIVRLDTQAEVEFRDETIQQVTGTIVVGAAPEVSSSPTPAPEAVDVEIPVTMTDTAFDPPEITIPAGQKFRINITNTGPGLACNLRLAGPDGDFNTEDDLASDTVLAGQTGEIVGQFDAAGTQPFRCDFRPNLSGTVTVTPPE